VKSLKSLKTFLKSLKTLFKTFSEVFSKNRVKTKNVPEKKGKIFLFDYCNPVYFDSE